MENIERKQRENERIVKRIQTLKRQLYAMREYQSQSASGLVSKDESTLEYYKQQLELRVKRNDALAHELEMKGKAKIEAIDAEIRALQAKKALIEEQTQGKIDGIENDATLAMYIKEIALRDARLMAGRPKSKAEIDKEQEIKDLEEAYKQGERYIKTATEEIEEGLRWARKQDDDFAKRREREEANYKRDVEMRTKLALELEANMKRAVAPAPKPKPVNELVTIKKPKKYIKQSVSDSEDESSSNSTTVSEFNRRQEEDYTQAQKVKQQFEEEENKLHMLRAKHEAEKAEAKRLIEEERQYKVECAKRYKDVEAFIENKKYDARYGREHVLVKKLVKEFNKFTPQDFIEAGGVPPSVQTAMDEFDA